MEQGFSESVAALKCCGKYRFAIGEIATALRQAVAEHGFALEYIQFVDTTEMVLYGDAGILSVCQIDEYNHDILIAAETPRGAPEMKAADQLRLLLCATATRVVCEQIAVSSISWWHKGAYHVTEQGRNFSPLLPRRKPNKSDRKGIRAALSAVSSARPTEGRIGQALRRHFPREADVTMASDRAG